MVHWAQGVRRKVESKPKFARYDYGQECVDPFGGAQPCNQNMYGSLQPPVYDLMSIRTPLAIFSGELHLSIGASLLEIAHKRKISMLAFH